jgi:hypothetical protein
MYLPLSAKYIFQEPGCEKNDASAIKYIFPKGIRKHVYKHGWLAGCG